MSTAMPAARRRAWPAPAALRIGIFQRRYDARNAGGNDGVGTRRRAAKMRARLERDVERRAARERTGAAQRLDFGVRTTGGDAPAAADNHAGLDDHRSDR